MELSGSQSNQNKAKDTIPYKAMYSFEATNDDEISLEVGDKLMVCNLASLDSYFICSCTATRVNSCNPMYVIV